MIVLLQCVLFDCIVEACRWRVFGWMEESHYNYLYCMSVRKSSQSIKERDEQHSKKNDDYLPSQKIRILQENLVFVSALPSDLSAKQILQKDIYFARYGKVSKLIINPSTPNKKGVLYQAYATYTCELDASIAIVALDGYKLSDKPLKVSFGTTKYCSHFLRGHECPNPDCFYLHKVERQREVNSGDTRIIFKQQNAKALKIVVESLPIIADRIVASQTEQIAKGFPSLTELLQYMTDSGELTQSDIDTALDQATLRRTTLPTKYDTRGLSLPDPVQQGELEQCVKLVKSSSLSTMCTPNKQTDLGGGQQQQIEESRQGQTHSKQKQNNRKQQKQTNSKQQKLNNRKQQKPIQNKQQKPTKSVQQKQREGIPQIQHKSGQKDSRQQKQTVKQVNKNKQNVCRQLCLSQKIQKLLLREILKKGSSECRSRFIKTATASREECSKFRGIVQRCLIHLN